MVPLLQVAEPGGLGDHLGSRQARIREAGQAFRQTPGRPAAQRGDHRLARAAGHRAELGEQRHQPGKRRFGVQVVVPVGGVQRLPERLVVSVTQVTQRRVYRVPQAVRARHALLAEHLEQGQHHQAHAVLLLGIRLRRAHRAQGGQPSGEQVRIGGRPVSQRGTAGHPAAAGLQQAGRDRDAPGPVQGPDVGHRARPRRHLHAESRARRGNVGLAQHLRGRHRTAARADPAGQRDGVSHDNALPREPRDVTEFVFRSRYAHIGTLQILGDPLQAPGMRVVIASPRCSCCGTGRSRRSRIGIGVVNAHSFQQAAGR